MQTKAENRSGNKRLAILEAARRLFLDQGYDGTSMDDVATEAGVSKPTVYRYFADKEQLFTEIVGNTTQMEQQLRAVVDMLNDSEDLEKDLVRLARRLLTPILQPEFLRLRRLVIGNAERFPVVGKSWYEDGFMRVVTTLADSLAHLAGKKRLQVEDPLLASHQFIGLLLWEPLNRAMYTGGAAFRESELDKIAVDAVRSFLAAYGVHGRRD